MRSIRQKNLDPTLCARSGLPSGVRPSGRRNHSRRLSAVVGYLLAATAVLLGAGPAKAACTVDGTGSSFYPVVWCQTASGFAPCSTSNIECGEEIRWIGNGDPLTYTGDGFEPYCPSDLGLHFVQGSGVDFVSGVAAGVTGDYELAGQFIDNGTGAYVVADPTVTYPPGPSGSVGGGSATFQYNGCGEATISWCHFDGEYCDTRTYTDLPVCNAGCGGGDPGVDVAVVKTGPATASAGELVAFAVQATNQGDLTATGVTLNDTVPGNATFDPASSSAGWVCVPNNDAGAACTLSIGTLSAGQSASRTFAVTLADPFPGGTGSVTNVACATLNETDTVPGNNCDPATTIITAQDTTITKTYTGGTIAPGGTITFQIDVSRAPGPTGSSRRGIRDVVPVGTTFAPGASSPGWVCTPSNAAGSTCDLPLGLMAPGTTQSRVFAVTLDTPIVEEFVFNTACAWRLHSSDAFLNELDCDDETVPLLAGEPIITISKSLVSGDGTPGGTLEFSVTVANQGTAGSASLVLDDIVPAYTTFLPASSSAAWVCPDVVAGSECFANLGVLAPGASVTLTFAVQVDSPLPVEAEGQLLFNEACVRDLALPRTDAPNAPLATVCDDASTPELGDPLLVIDKALNPASTPVPGGQLIYEITVTNTGNQDSAGDVIADGVPAWTTFLPGSSSPGWLCTPDNNAGAGCSINTGPLAGNGGSVSFTFVVAIANPLPLGVEVIGNTACIAAGCDSVDTPVVADPVIVVDKVVSGGDANPDSTLIYQITVTNTGNQGSDALVLTDTVPAYSTFNAAASTAGWSCVPGPAAGSVCSIAVPGLAGGGGSASFLFAVTIDNPLPAGAEQTTNVACVGAACDSVDTPLGGDPNIVVDKIVSGGDANPGSTLIYQITVTNSGDQGSAPLALTDTVPAFSTFNAAASTVGWSCVPGPAAGSVCTMAVPGLAGGGGSISFLFAVTIDDPLPLGAEQTTNVACVGSACDSVDTPLGGDPNIVVDKTVAGGDANPGSTLIYQIVVTNNGDQAAAASTLTDTVPSYTSFNAGASTAGWSCVPGPQAGAACSIAVPSLAGNGGSAAFLFAVTIDNPLPAGAEQTTNVACVGSACDSVDTPLGGDPNIVVDKRLESGAVLPGAVLAYEIRVSNTGNQASDALTLTDTVPSNTTFVAAQSAAGWSCVPGPQAGSVCSLPIAPLPAGGSSSFLFAVRLDEPLPQPLPTISNTACVGAICDTVVTPPAVPLLVIDKQLVSGTVGSGNTLVFDVVVTNTGASPAANVVVSDVVPASSTFAPGSSSAGIACVPDSNPGASCSITIPSVAAYGGTATVQFAFTLASPWPGGDFVNVACLPDACDTIIVPPPGGGPLLTIDKTTTSGSPAPNAVLVYTLAVSNDGSLDAPNVTLSETVPAETSFVAASSSAGWLCSPSSAAGSACTLEIGTVAAGATVLRTFAVQLAADYDGTTPIPNTACVESSDCDTVVDPPAGGPSLSIDKALVSGSFGAGQTITYSITVANQGTQNALDVAVTDTVPANTTFLPASSSPSWNCVPGSAAGSVCTSTQALIGPGQSVTLTFAVLTDTPIPAGVTQIANTACIGTVCDTVTITGVPGLAIDKSATAAQVLPGGEVAFTIQVANGGQVDLGGVIASDVVPAGTSVNALSSSAGWSCVPSLAAGSTCTLPVGTLAVGASQSYSLVLEVAADYQGGSLTNEACATSAAPTTGPVCDTATVAIGVPEAPPPVSCSIDAVPAATLLLPYFEVDLDDPNGVDTFFSVSNASERSALAHVVVWTDMSVEALDFNIYLTGYDVQTVGLGLAIRNGLLPRTGDANSLSNVGAYSEPHPGSQSAVDFGSCASYLPYGSPALSEDFLAHLQSILTGGPSAIYAGRCGGFDHGDRIARGYVTVDVVRDCTLSQPCDPGYFTGPNPIATHDNILWGDWYRIDYASNYAQGDTLVHIEAHDPEDPATLEMPGTFWGRCAALEVAPHPYPDYREPLPTTFASRFYQNEAFTGGTDFFVWRDALYNVYRSDHRGFDCAEGPSWYPLNERQVVFFDEAENPEAACTLSPCPEDGILFPLEAQSVSIAGLDVAPQSGWVYLNLNQIWDYDAGTLPTAAQAWVVSVHSAEGRFSAGLPAVQLDSFCDLQSVTLGAGSGFPAIDEEIVNPFTGEILSGDEENRSPIGSAGEPRGLY